MSGATQDKMIYTLGVIFALTPLVNELFIKKGKKSWRYIIFLIILATSLIVFGWGKANRDSKEKKEAAHNFDSLNTKLNIVIAKAGNDSIKYKEFLEKLSDTFKIVRDSATNEPIKKEYNTKIGKARDVFIGNN